MKKLIFKGSIIAIGIGVVGFPVSFGLTSPDHLAWMFYADITLLFGGICIAVLTIMWMAIDLLIS